ncbi:hypothetical protein C8Q75DRAFT_809525 [Abortiporus biennis]|nr:hypothetical protein C8Q75DRAFT_809525 [Abortiporus biennis]
MLPDLPPELWEDIILSIPRSDLHSVTLVSKWFCQVAQPLLFAWQRVTVTQWRKDNERTLGRLKFLSTATNIASKGVRKLSIDTGNYDLLADFTPNFEVPLEDILLKTGLEMIPLFVNLRTFCGYELKLTPEHIQHLHSLPNLNVLILYSCSISYTEDSDSRHSPLLNVQDTTPSSPPPPLPTQPFSGSLHRFEFLNVGETPSSHPAWWASFLSPSQTDFLRFFHDQDSDQMMNILSDPQSPSMKSLHTIKLRGIKTTSEIQFISALSHCPSLRCLDILDTSWKPSVDILEDELSKTPDAAPHLEDMIGLYRVVRPFVRYRNLRAVELISKNTTGSWYRTQILNPRESELFSSSKLSFLD